MQSQIIRFVIMLCIGATIGAWSAVHMMSTRHALEMATLQAQFDGFKRQVVENNSIELGRQLEQRSAQREEIQTAEKESNERLAIETKKLTDLRACVAAGNCGLRYTTVKNPFHDPGVPAGGETFAGDDETVCGLTADAEQAYFDIRQAIIDQREQINLLQTYALTVSAE